MVEREKLSLEWNELYVGDRRSAAGRKFQMLGAEQNKDLRPEIVLKH